jgi:preprotein translocase subunit YajC
MTRLAYLFLMGQPAAGSTPQSQFVPLLFLIGVFVVFYFFMIRPQMKKQKEMNNYRSSLQKGDKVVTTGGIYGRIAEVKDTYVMMEIGGDVKIKVDKNAVLKDSSDIEQK